MLDKIIHFWAEFKLIKILFAQISFFSYLVCFNADQMAGLKFTDMHNLAIVLADPPVAHGEFKSMIHGLKECCLASAITMNTVVYQSIIKEFWQTSKMRRDDDGPVTIDAIVKG